MFGYVRPRRDELRMREYDRYHAAYCGVCRSLGREYGFFSRFLVNYDMTFLYLLLASVEAAKPNARCRCPAKLGCVKKDCVDDEALLGYVAAVDVILCRHKLQDNIRDSGFFKGLAYRLAALLISGGYRRAKKRLPDFDRITEQRLAVLQALEGEQSSSIDRTADAFASILEHCADLYDDPALRRPFGQLLYHVGRFIYLVDALDDLAEDCKTGNYNPLRFRFTPEEGRLRPEDQTYLGELLEGSINLAGAALALLPLKTDGDLLENIIYLGLPAVRKAVEAGSFHQQAKI